MNNSSGKGLVLGQWLPLIYEGEPTPLPALPFEVSFYPSKGGGDDCGNLKKLKKAKRVIFTFFGFGPLKYRFLGFSTKKFHFWIFCSKSR